MRAERKAAASRQLEELETKVLAELEGQIDLMFTKRGCSGITTKRILQDSREFGVSVWDVTRIGFGIGESTDYLTKAEKTFVDADTFFQELACGTSLFDSLRTRQVDEVKFG